MKHLLSIRTSHALTRSARAAAIAAGVSLMALATAGSGARAETWFVDSTRPDDTGSGLSWSDAKRTIGAAIGASAAGDTILVKYGTYMVSDAVVLSSDRCLGSDDGTHTSWDEALPDSSLCLVSADATCRVMTITGAAVTPATIVRGFTLTGGDATDPSGGHGGGLDVSGGSDPIIERCRATGNVADHTGIGYGGGISVRGAGSSAEIRYCRIDDNLGSSRDAGYGGGIHVSDGGHADIHQCAIVANRGSVAHSARGGGVAVEGGDAVMEDCEVAFNVAATTSGLAGGGGGLYAIFGTLVARRCEITDNVAAQAYCRQGTGGGAYLVGAAGTQIVDSHIARNVASLQGKGNGGGIWAGSGQVMRGNVIEDNYATVSELLSYSCNQGRGGGVGLTDSNSDLSENLIKDNVASLHAEGSGGGIYFESANRIVRNVVWGNVASGAAAGWGGGVYTGGGTGSSLRNNTIVRNANTLLSGGGGAGSGFYHGNYPSGPSVENNIFCDNDVPGSDGMGAFSEAAMTISYNDFHNNSGGNYNGLITSIQEQSGGPCFADGANGDFTLLYDSPCIETGNPATPVPENGGWVVDIGAFEYTGTRHWRAIGGAGEYLFGGRVKAKVNLTDAGTLSSLDMFVFPGVQHPQAPGSIQRYYTIDPTGTPVLFDLTLSYLDSELNGADEDSLAMWRRAGASWEGPKAATARDLMANWLTVGDQTVFSDWVIAARLDVVVVPGDPDLVHDRSFSVWSYPNPFNPQVRIAYYMPFDGPLAVRIYDLGGRLVRTLLDRTVEAGPGQVTWDGRSDNGEAVASGVYVYRTRGSGRERTGKLTLVR